MTTQLDLEKWGLKVRRKPYTVSLEFIEETCERQPLIKRLNEITNPNPGEERIIEEKLEETRA